MNIYNKNAGGQPAFCSYSFIASMVLVEKDKN